MHLELPLAICNASHIQCTYQALKGEINVQVMRTFSICLRLCVCICVCGWGLATDALFPLGAFALAHCEGDKNFLSYFQMKNNPTQNAAGLC